MNVKSFDDNHIMLLQAVENGIARDVKRLVEEVGVPVDGPGIVYDPTTVPAPELSKDGALLLSAPKDVTYISPLNWAVFHGRLPTAQYLVNRAGSNPNGVSCDGRTPLHTAVSKGNAEAIQWLVEQAKCNINAINFAGETPLYHALYFDRPEVAGYLLEHGANVSATTAHGFSAAHMIANRGNTKLLARLLAADPVLVNLAANDGTTPLHLAALAGRIEAVRMLCAQGADVTRRNGRDETALALAVGAPHADAHATAALLVQHGALTAEGPRARELSGVLLHAACASEMPAGALLQMLIDHGLDTSVARNGQSALHTAAFNTNFEAVKVLVAAGLDVNAEDEDGDTALFHADMAGSTAIVAFLKSHGAH